MAQCLEAPRAGEHTGAEGRLERWQQLEAPGWESAEPCAQSFESNAEWGGSRRQTAAGDTVHFCELKVHACVCDMCDYICNFNPLDTELNSEGTMRRLEGLGDHSPERVWPLKAGRLAGTATHRPKGPCDWWVPCAGLCMSWPLQGCLFARDRNPNRNQRRQK